MSSCGSAISWRRRPRLDPIAQMGDLQLISALQPPDLDPLSIDPGAVGAAEITDKNFAMVLDQATMVA